MQKAAFNKSKSTENRRNYTVTDRLQSAVTDTTCLFALTSQDIWNQWL